MGCRSPYYLLHAPTRQLFTFKKTQGLRKLVQVDRKDTTFGLHSYDPSKIFTILSLGFIGTQSSRTISIFRPPTLLIIVSRLNNELVTWIFGHQGNDRQEGKLVSPSLRSGEETPMSSTIGHWRTAGKH